MKKEYLMDINTFVNQLDFEIFKDTKTDYYKLVDLQGGNLGNIEKDDLTDVHDIIERLGVYIDEYFNDELGQVHLMYNVDVSDFSLGELKDFLKSKGQKIDDFLDCVLNPDLIDMENVRDLKKGAKEWM